MNRRKALHRFALTVSAVLLASVATVYVASLFVGSRDLQSSVNSTPKVSLAAFQDVSPRLDSFSLRPGGREVLDAKARRQDPPAAIVTPDGSGAVEQRSHGVRAPAELVVSFDGLGVGFEGPQGTSTHRNPSDNSLAVGPDHVFQIVNSRMAIFDKTGKVLYGPMPTNTVFRGFGGAAGSTNNGDAVVRYDQLADRWLIVMPIFRRGVVVPGLPETDMSGAAQESTPAIADQPGDPRKLYAPTVKYLSERGNRERLEGPYSMCYAISVTSDPLGEYYRYEFLRPLFPDYPRPAVWPDGYYVPTSTSDNFVQKHACVVEREKMLRGQPAIEQCVVIDGVNFLNNADIDGFNLPPEGAPNIMMATGGTQLEGDVEDDGIYVWKFHVDWEDPAKTTITGPEKIDVAPYRYLGDGQLTNTVPQPGTDQHLDSQGDKIMARLVYRRIGDVESLVAVHSVNTTRGGGGVRWYEFRVGADRSVGLHQQGTLAPDSDYRWMASPAMDKFGNIGIGYSFGGKQHFVGQRFAGRLAGDRLGRLTLRERILVNGEGVQERMRWEDYTQTAVDPTDDRTIWYVGDYIREGESEYSTRIGAFLLPEN